MEESTMQRQGRAWMVAVIGLSVGSAPALASPERDAQAHYSTASHAFEEGDFAKAAEELKAAIAIKPTVKALLMLGNTYLKLSQLDDAKAAFEKVLELDPRSSKRK